jgi:hypothetical protein
MNYTYIALGWFAANIAAFIIVYLFDLHRQYRARIARKEIS